MKLYQALLGASLCLVSTLSHADYTMLDYFSCTTTNNKHIAIDYYGDNIMYRYGKQGSPEIRIPNGKEIGTNHDLAWGFKNGQYGYVVYYDGIDNPEADDILPSDGFDDLETEIYLPSTAGVFIYHYDNVIDNIACEPDTITVGNG